MLRHDLGVDECSPGLGEALEEVKERDLRGVGSPMEHGLRREDPSDLDPVAPADQGLRLPDLDRVHPAERRQLQIGLPELRRDPRALSPVRTGADDLRGRQVDGRGPAAPPEGPLETPADTEAGQGQDGARIGTEPRQRHALVWPGEDAGVVRADQGAHVEIGPDAHQSVRISCRGFHVPMVATYRHREWRRVLRAGPVRIVRACGRHDAPCGGRPDRPRREARYR